MTDISPPQSGSASWFSRHSRIVSIILLVGIGAGYFAYQMWSIYDSIPALPGGMLQMVGLSGDGARFVLLDGEGFNATANRVVVLVAFNKPMHADEGNFSFEAKRETIDCAKREIALEGAGFYDDQGRQVLSRVFDKKPKPAEAIDTEATLVCDHQKFEQPTVTGYQAALVQTQAAISRIYGSH